MQDLKDRQIAELRVQRNNAYDESAQFGARFTEAHEALEAEKVENQRIRNELAEALGELSDLKQAKEPETIA